MTRPQRLTPRLVPKKEWGGEVWFEGQGDLPLLIKYLFTTAKLSVQVHPGDDYAREHHNSRGKTEMWHVLSAQPGAKVAAGFRKSLTEERLRASAQSGAIERLLQWHDARPGDTFFIPAGTVHAIGAGLVLCEIQQHSNITYRLYDYGRPRELHLDHGVRVSHREPSDPRSSKSKGVLVKSPYFTTHLIPLKKPASVKASSKPEYWICLEGPATIGGEKVEAGEVLYFAESSDVQLSGTGRLLRVIAH